MALRLNHGKFKLIPVLAWLNASFACLLMVNCLQVEGRGWTTASNQNSTRSVPLCCLFFLIYGDSARLLICSLVDLWEICYFMGTSSKRYVPCHFLHLYCILLETAIKREAASRQSVSWAENRFSNNLKVQRECLLLGIPSNLKWRPKE